MLKNSGCAFFRSEVIATIASNFSGTTNGLTKSSTSSLIPVKACVSDTSVSACTCSFSFCFSALLPRGFLSMAAYLPAISFCKSITVSEISLPPTRASSPLSTFLPTSPVEIILPVLCSNSSISCWAVALSFFATPEASSRLAASSVASALNIFFICASVPPIFLACFTICLLTTLVP